jgi:hypothetical protein
MVVLKRSSWLLTVSSKATTQPNYNLLIEEGETVDT